MSTQSVATSPVAPRHHGDETDTNYRVGRSVWIVPRGASHSAVWDAVKRAAGVR